MTINVSKQFNLKIVHDIWSNVYEQVFALANINALDRVIAVIGPSRVGKSKLILALENTLAPRNGQNNEMTVLSVIASNNGPGGRFSSKSFVLQMLDKLQHPVYSIPHGESPNDPKAFSFTRATEHTLNLALEKAIFHRKVKYLIIDEVQHIRYGMKSHQLYESYLDSLKCLAQKTNIVLIIVGTYPILEVIKESPHFVGRLSKVHFRRYMLTEFDKVNFLAILKRFEEILTPICPKEFLIKNADFLYQYSLGVIGLLANWLMNATMVAQLEGKTLSRELLEHNKLDRALLESVEKEILQGEHFFTNENDGQVGEKKKESKTRGRPAVKPFQAKPKRRKMGNREVSNG